MSQRQNLIILLAILALAAFFRFYQLDQIPPGLYPDVAINGNEALNNPGKVFYPENNGREGLMMNLIVLFFALFGVSIWSIKAVAAIFGTLTVLGTYLLCKELFPQKNPEIDLRNHPQASGHGPSAQILSARERAEDPSERARWASERVSQVTFPNSSIPLLASFFLAISFWHLNFSRFGFRAILLPFVLVFAFYFLFRGIRTKKLLNFIIAGLIFGLGFYTYSSFRMAVLLLPVPLLYFLFNSIRVGQLKKYLLSTLCFLTVIFAVALPIGLYFLSHPADFASRAAPISVFAQAHPINAFTESFIRHLAMFNIYGDPNWRHNYPGSPQLLWPIGILFIIGITISIKNAFNLLKTKNHQLLTASCFLFAWLFVMLLPGALTYEGMPHALRTIGVLPIPYIFAAIGAVAMYSLFNQRIKNKKILTSIVIIFISTLTFTGYYDYFIKWGKNSSVQGAFTASYVEIGEYLNSLPEGTKKYVIVNEGGVPVPLHDGLPVPAQTPMFIESTKYGKPQAIYLKPENLDAIVPTTATVIVPMKYDENLFNTLLQKFPQGIITAENGITVFNLGL